MKKLLIYNIILLLVAIGGCGNKDEDGDGNELRSKTKPDSLQEIQNSATAQTNFMTEPQLLAGETGSSQRWGSGWLDLAKITDFTAGDMLRLRIGGSANKVLVRLLPEGKFPDSSVGTVNGPISVPKNRIVQVVLDKKRKDIIQISVHGGPNPWGKYPLGDGNGPATLEMVELIHSQ